MGNLHSKKLKSKNGFTLLEVIVSFGIFTSAMLIAVSIFVTVNGVQRRVVSNQKIQDDMRQVVDAIAQQVRLGSIHYTYYMDPNLDGSISVAGGNTDAIDLHPIPLVDGPVTTLAVIDQSGDYVYFNHDASSGRGILQYCKLTSAVNPATNCTWLDITPALVDITDLRFIITPSADPFLDFTAVMACTDDSDCIAAQNNPIPYSWESARCDTVTDNRCEYYTDGGNYQPKVRMIVEAKGTSGKVREQGHIQLETVISTRQITPAVLNDFGDADI